MPRTQFPQLRLTIPGRIHAILAAVSIAAAGCQTFTMDDKTDYRVEDSKMSSVLDARLKNLTERVREYPKRDDLHYEIAGIFYKKGDLRMCAAAIQRAIDLAPNEAKYHYQLGRVQLGMKELDKAEMSYREAVRLLPDRLAAPYAALGDVLAQKRDTAGAIAEFRKCLEIEPENATYYYILGCLHDMRGEREATIHHFQEYLARGGTTYRKKALFLLENLGVAVERLPRPGSVAGGRDGPILDGADPWADDLPGAPAGGTAGAGRPAGTVEAVPAATGPDLPSPAVSDTTAEAVTAAGR